MSPATSVYAQENMSAKPASDWQASDDDALLLDLRVGQYRLGDGIRGYQTDTGVCLDLADTIMALDVPVRLDKKSRRATGWLFAEQEKLVVDRDQNIVQNMNMRRALRSGEIYDTPEGWCIDADSLSQWMGIKLTPDLSNALILLSANRKLPFELAAERRERAAKVRPSKEFDLADLPQASQPYKFWQTPSVDAVVTIGGLRDARTARQVDARYELFASGEIGKASFDARLASDNHGVPESLRVRAYRTDPRGELLGPAQATQVAIGDVSTYSTPLVAQTAIGRGGFITNRPVERPDTYDRTSFRGSLPVGWDAELYRNGQLLAFAESRADGRYKFIDVPLLYGQNSFEVVLYGPQGQVRREQQVVPVGLDSIPPRKTYYWAGVSDAGRDLITIGDRLRYENAGWRGSFGLERGIDVRTSLAASYHSLRVAGIRRNYLEASLRRAIGPALAEVSAAYDLSGGSAVRGQILGQAGNSYFRAETIWAQNDFRSDLLEENVNGRHMASLYHFFKIGRSTLPVELEAQYKTRTTGDDTIEIASRISYNLRRISLTSELRYRKEVRTSGPAPPDQVDVGLLANLRIGKVRLRGESRFRLSSDSRFDRASIVAEWRAGTRSDLRAEIGYDALLDRVRGAFGYIRQFERFSLNASTEVASDGSVAAGLNLAFSIGPDPRNGRIRFSNEKLATNGQAYATVFRDRNGDGIRQADEPIEAGVELVAGRAVAERPTDADGRAIIDGLRPFQPVLIGIDAGSLPDPFVQPANSGVVVTPRPGLAARIELPLVSAGEIDGTLIRDGGATLEGVDLELRDVENRVVARTRSEFDGFFLFESVPYGGYTVTVAPLSADAAQVKAVLGVRAVVSDAETSVNLGYVKVQSSQPKVASAGEQEALPK